MLFFVKKTDGLLVMDEPAGAPIDVQLMWALDCVPPTVEQLGTMTLNSLECFPHQIGYRIKNAVGHGKDSLISYILGKWNFYVEKALEATHIRPSVKLNHKGKPFFIDNGRGMCPMLIRAGQIVELNHLTTYTADITKDIFDTMTATELRWSISVVFGHHKFEDKTHDALVNRLHELYVAHVNLHEQELLTIPIADDDCLSVVVMMKGKLKLKGRKMQNFRWRLRPRLKCIASLTVWISHLTFHLPRISLTIWSR